MREQHTLPFPDPPEPRTCAACGAEMTRRPNESPWAFSKRKSCSDPCARALKTPNGPRGPYKKRPSPPKPVSACLQCGQSFDVSPNTIGKYCSRSCYHQARERLITCERCGKQFKRRDSASRPSRFCSNACKRTGWDEPKPCAYCGATFTPTHRREQQHCSSQCASLFRHESDLRSGKRIARRLRMRCHKTLTDAVVARDGAICHLCTKPIDLTLSGHDLMGLTIDHVIPIARGGSHTLDNLKPAHRTCNARKSSRMPDG